MTKEANDFWSSDQSRNFPYSVKINGKEQDLIYEYQIPSGLHEWLISDRLIPGDGLLMDIGSGATTTSLFSESEKFRSYAADISPDLLKSNALLPDHKIILDVGSGRFPDSWRGKFGLAVSARCNRYLNMTEKRHLAGEVYHLLRPGSDFIILDIDSTPYAKQMGEFSPFDVKGESEILKNSGFSLTGSGHFEIKVKDHKFGGTDYIGHQYIIARK